MSDSYLLANDSPIIFPRTFGTGSIFVIQSATWERQSLMHTWSYALIQFGSGQGSESTIHIELRLRYSDDGPTMDIYSKGKGGKIPVTDDFFHNSEFNITIYDTVDRWEIFASYRHIFSLPKMSQPFEKIEQISYFYGRPLPLAEVLVISHHDCLARMAPPSLEVRPIQSQIQEEYIKLSFMLSF